MLAVAWSAWQISCINIFRGHIPAWHHSVNHELDECPFLWIEIEAIGECRSES